MKMVANLVASVFHPATLILPAVFLIVFRSASDYKSAFFWTFVSLIFTGFVAAFVLYGVRRGIFSDIDISVKKQRIILYPFVVVVTLLFTGVIYLFNGPSLLIFAGILFVAALIIMDFINIKIKASIHVASIAAIVTGIVYLYGGYSIFLYILLPLVAWARISEKKHTLAETFVGALSGIILTISAIFIVQFLL